MSLGAVGIGNGNGAGVSVGVGVATWMIPDCVSCASCCGVRTNGVVVVLTKLLATAGNKIEIYHQEQKLLTDLINNGACQ